MRWLAPRRFRRTRARYGAGVLAFIALASQLGSVAHLSLVKHVECADHGEMVEVSTDTGAQTGLADLSKTALLPEAAPTRGHDHCAIAAFRRERSQTASTSAVVVPLLRSDGGPSSVGPTAPPPVIAILDLAPKNSPPAV